MASFPSGRAPRVEMINLSTLEFVTCQFNPATLKKSITVNYARQPIPGLSHQPLQYASTSNRVLPDVEFFTDSVHDPEYDAAYFRAFLESLTVTEANPVGVPDTRPPRCLFLWPGVVTFECVLTRVVFTYQLFTVSGTPRLVQSAVTLEEVRDVRVSSEDLLVERPLRADEINDFLGELADTFLADLASEV